MLVSFTSSHLISMTIAVLRYLTVKNVFKKISNCKIYCVLVIQIVFALGYGVFNYIYSKPNSVITSSITDYVVELIITMDFMGRWWLY